MPDIKKPDREKVVKAVDTAFDIWIDEYEGTSYYNIDEVKLLKEDALALLKEQEHKDRMFRALEEDWKRLKELLQEQEAVEPRVSTAEQRCGQCNKVIKMDGWIACPWCGKRIDWESWRSKWTKKR